METFVANEGNSTKEFVIPVSWEVFDTIKVQANTIQEAYEWAVEHSDEIPLGAEPSYVDGSYKINAESPEECEIYQ